MRAHKILNSVRDGMWFVPVMCVIAGVLISIATSVLDRRYDYELVPTSLAGGPDAALAILATIAASMVSLAALVLTVTMVVVQLAMGQFSPRIVQTILRDKPSQVAIGIFVATFAHAMLAMREVSLDGGGQVPGVAIIVAFVMVLVSIAVLVIYVHHIGQSLRVASLIELVGTQTRELLEDLYPDSVESSDDAPPGLRVISAPSSGVVSYIDHEALVEVASQARCRLALIPGIGQFVPAGAPLFEVDGGGSEPGDDQVTKHIAITLERSLDQDVAYGLRLLVDIAERSISDSAFEDPTTAVQAIDRLHDCLRQLAPRRFPDGKHRDDEGDIRLSVPTASWEDFVHLAFEEIRMAGAGSPQVSRRLHEALEDLLTVAPPARRPVLREEIDRLDFLIKQRVDHRGDADAASDPDALGLG